MQDQAKPHLAAATQKWLDRHMKGWLKRWPRKVGGLNPSDYGLWSQVQESICADKPAAILELQASGARRLAAIPEGENRKCVAACPKRVRPCGAARRGPEKNGTGTL